MGVTEVTSESNFNDLIKAAKGKLVVVDFFATWCGPCKTIAPIYNEWSNKYTKEAVFLKLDVDKVREVAQSAGVKNLPSFGFYHEGKLLDLVVGGNPKVMEDKIKALSEKHSTFAFRGAGNSLVGASSAAAAPKPAAAAATTAASAPARRNPWADPNFHLAKKAGADAAPAAAASSTPAAKPAATAAAAPKPAAATPAASGSAAPKQAAAAPASSGSAAAAAGGNRVNPWASKDAKDIAPAAAAPAPAPAAAAAPTPAAAPAAAAPAAAPAATSAPAAASATPASAAPAAAAGAAKGNDPSLTKQLNPEFLNALMGMGFSQLRAEKGLILTGNKSVDQALNYLMENENAPDIDEPLQVVGTSASSSSSSGPNLDDMDDDERAIFEQLQKKKMAEKGVAFSGGANAAPAKKSTLDMTHEEKMQWLENRRAEVKLRKEAEAISAIKDKEAQRKKNVVADHKADELREAMQRKQADDAIRIKRKEEEDRKKARAATLAKLEEDKKRRREQQERDLAAIAAQKAAAAAGAAKK